MKNNLVSEIKLHKNGIQYKEIEVNPGLILKLFNTNKPQRLEEESFMEYKFRQRLNNEDLKNKLKGKLFHDSSKLGTYINKNK